MEKAMPRQFEELVSACALLERHYRDVQDVEFTVEQGRLWVLQTRTAKRNAKAAAKIAVDMAFEGLITQDEAVSRVDPEVLAQDPHPLVDPQASVVELGRGLAASPGAATGEIVFHSEDAVEAAEQGRSVILVRVETMPDDIEGMHAAAGVLTTRGGMTSHAAVVARGMGKPCVVGAAGLHVDFRAGRLVAGSTSFAAGDVITVDGSTGRVIEGAAPTIRPELAHDIALLREWTEEAALRAGATGDDDEPDDGDDAAWRP
jgi:pyruvate,orthophosphate dikinase